MSRTRKQPYRGSRAFDRTCRCHGGCPACLGNRMAQQRKALAAVQAQLKEAT